MCGIFGIINTKKSKFNKTLFNVLGVHNDTRGGDSCGIFIDGKVEYGVNSNKLYSNFLKTSNLLKETHKCKIALGHCRKASVGVINESTAQPVVLKNDNGEIEYVLMHNGTIYNYRALAAKYIPNINITGMTDSQVMARIFYHCGYNCLSEYYGGAVFVIVDYRKEEPQVLLWKGASRNNKYSPNLTEERPLYFIQTNNTLVFSSLNTYIEAAFMEEAFTLYENQLVEVKDDDIYIVEEYSRKDVAQTLPYNYGADYYNDVFGYNDSDYLDWDNPHVKTTPVVKKDTSKPKNKCSIIRITTDGIFYRGTTPAHGRYFIDKFGNIHDTKVEGTIECWFWDGILLYGNDEFIFLINASKHYKLEVEEVKWCCPELLNSLSPYPVKDTDYCVVNDGHWVKCTDPQMGFELYTGHLHLVTESKQMYCLNGSENFTTWSSKDINFESVQKLLNKKNINFTNLYSTLYSDESI